MGKVALTKVTKTSPFRKVAMGTWKTAKDPSVYGIMEIDMKPTLDALEGFQKKHDVRITPAHLVGRAVSRCMVLRPEINAMIRGSRIYLRDQVSLFYQVNIPGKGSGDDKVKKATLSGAILHDTGDSSVLDIAKKLREKASLTREGKDKEFSKNMAIFNWLPWWICGFYLDFVSWLIYGLNLNLGFLGVPKDPFGSVMITSVGGMGIDIALAPLCPYTRVPLLLAVGAITDKAWVVDGKVEVRPIMPIAATFDHRLIDGVHAAQMAAEFKRCFAEPEKFLLND